MNPALMAFVILSLVSLFAWSAWHRAKLLRVGEKTFESRLDRPGRRLGMVWTFALYQKKMRYYLWAGLAHQLIFLGFVVLLLRSIILWGRGFDPTFNLWILGDTSLGHLYAWLKDVFATLVLLGVAVFFYYRVIRPQKRMALGWEGLVILGIIATMMLGDMLYDGAARALQAGFADHCGSAEANSWCRAAATIIAPYAEDTSGEALSYHFYPEPAGSLFALGLMPLSTSALVVLAHAGYWSHATLVLVFLNILPYSKHFHIITAIPNVFLGDLTPRGRLRPIAANTEGLMEKVEKASEHEDMNGARLGYSRIEHFTWKDILDFYTCTECGRCSDNCPATTTGKVLSPKHLTLDLRNHLYQRQEEFLRLGDGIPRVNLDSTPADDASQGSPAESTVSEEHGGASGQDSKAGSPYRPIDLVPDVVQADVLWGCTTCRACEQQCPVNITYVDKIVQMRRHLVMIRGEFPGELNKPFEGMETNGNPWNLARVDRKNWAEGLSLPTLADAPRTEVLFWVGCAASYDDRSKKIARATAELMKAAGVQFAILGDEENCTGDPARRAGNEYLFSMLAETNIETLNGYQAQGGARTIVTTCPHCFNTLANEYGDFGGSYQVVHHTDFLLGLLAEGRLKPTQTVRARVVFHDSCYLGRYNDIYQSPRDILSSIPGVELVEVEASRDRGLCCGAGGAQMWMEEQNQDRVNVKRTGQLLTTGADTIASACPFCMTMLTDGVKAAGTEDRVKNLDVVELLKLSCNTDQPTADGSSPS